MLVFSVSTRLLLGKVGEAAANLQSARLATLRKGQRIKLEFTHFQLAGTIDK